MFKGVVTCKEGLAVSGDINAATFTLKNGKVFGVLALTANAAEKFNSGLNEVTSILLAKDENGKMIATNMA